MALGIYNKIPILPIFYLLKGDCKGLGIQSCGVRAWGAGFSLAHASGNCNPYFLVGSNITTIEIFSNNAPVRPGNGCCSQIQKRQGTM